MADIPAMTQRSLMLVLHDVAPQTWPDYRAFVEADAMLRNSALIGLPLTFVVKRLEANAKKAR